MRLYYEWGIQQIRKRNEELCGDSVLVSRRSDSVTLALSDGLGSGVKANILATLTTRIAMHLLQNDLPLSEVVETLSKTLPVCEVRKLAYSTFVIAQFFGDGRARIVEFDTPPAILLRQRRRVALPYQERAIGNKTIHETVVDLEIGDWVVLVSDGVLNAGIGGVYPLGWGHEQTGRYLEEHTHPERTAQEVADNLGEAVTDLYAGPPGDDVSVVVIKVRHKIGATVLTGPPASKDLDEPTIARFLNRSGMHMVCGGTTATIVSRQTGEPLEVDLETMRDNVPPMARMKNMDLVTEGILTLTRVHELLRAGATREKVRFQTDGASALIREMLSADHVHFIVGMAVNPAHQNPDLPGELDMKLTVVREIANELTRRGLEATIESV